MDEDKILSRVREDPSALSEIGGGLPQDFYDRAFEANSEAFAFIPEENRTASMSRAALKASLANLRHVPDRYKTIEDCVAAVTKNSSLTRFVPRDILDDVLALVPEERRTARTKAWEEFAGTKYVPLASDPDPEPAPQPGKERRTTSSPFGRRQTGELFRAVRRACEDDRWLERLSARCAKFGSTFARAMTSAQSLLLESHALFLLMHEGTRGEADLVRAFDALAKKKALFRMSGETKSLITFLDQQDAAEKEERKEREASKHASPASFEIDAGALNALLGV